VNTQYYEYKNRDIAIRFEGTHPLTVGQSIIDSILALSEKYYFNLAVLSVGRSYEVELVDGGESTRLFWLVIGQYWNEVYLAA
jgi:hypothetical protein